MQLYDLETQTGLCQEIDRLCDSTDKSYSRLAKTARLNDANGLVVAWIIGADGTWQFDDSNYTDLPVGVGTLEEGLAQYSFAIEFLDIIEVEVKDQNGRWHKLKPIDPAELGDLTWDQYFGVNADGTPYKGLPRNYDKNADGIVLGPAPAGAFVTLVGGLRVTFQRKAVSFTPASTTADDTMQPGFASPFHVILAYMASIPYCMSYKKDRVPAYMQKVGDTVPASGMKKAILDHYGRRQKDVRKVATMKRIRFR